MRTKLLFSIGLSVSFLALTACSLTQKSAAAELTAQQWNLTELNGQPLVTGSAITANFSPDGKVSGSAGCNQYNGSYKTNGNKITFITPLARTLMMCDPGVMDQETAYLDTLGKVTTFSIKDNDLSLLNADKSQVAHYRAQARDLAGTSWQVISYNNGKQAVTSVIIGTTLTAQFNADGTLSGNSGCNSYNGSYTTDRNKITVGPLASTKKYCSDPAGIMDQETLYLAALQSASTYQIDGNTLELRTQDGGLAANFAKNP